MIENEFEGYDNFFWPLAETLTKFAEDHNLLVEKYYHDVPMWSLCFNHPKGGQAKIDITKVGVDRIEISSAWWLDEYEKSCRSLKRGKKAKLKMSPGALKAGLAKTLKEILAWERGDWTTVATGYESAWSGVTKGQLESWASKWPTPKGWE